MDYVLTALFAYLFGHSMGRAICMDHYPKRTGEAAQWIVAQLKEVLGTGMPIDSDALTRYLDSLHHDIERGHMEFRPARSMKDPGSVMVGGRDHGPIAEIPIED